MSVLAVAGGLHGFPYLLADMDIDDIIKIALFVIFVFGSLILKGIGTLFESIDRGAKAGRARQKPAAKDLEAQLSEWLKEPPKRDRPGRAHRAGRGPAPAGAEVVTADVVTANPPAEAIVAARPPLADDRAPSLLVRPSVNPAAVAAEADRLVSDIGLADERLEQHLRDAFHERVSRLVNEEAQPLYQVAEGTDAAAAESEPAPMEELLAARIFEQLRSPLTVREAIVMAEVLRRPAERT